MGISFLTILKDRVGKGTESMDRGGEVTSRAIVLMIYFDNLQVRELEIRYKMYQEPGARGTALMTARCLY